ncbi:activating signal cointegrator 1 complex subunit 2 isoform X2 [Polypterus senegalus]|uniref:activating signal cointegrator 1 complex subunit 2 isoform X2 n=1 Tax=Polypterus senegalus TaxID=55291 RepID=UPI0019663F68|nr:activating signal cointegrator 1 complex subunit 2 isoform X2 [Polypterus senegalus]
MSKLLKMAKSNVPLDELQVTERDPRTGKEISQPALHPNRCEDRCFVLYKPPSQDGSPADVEEYLELAQFIAEDLDWVLSLPHDKFWCQVVFDESLQKCLESYLRLAPRGFDSDMTTSPAVSDMQKHLHRSVFFTFLRMATHKESKDHFITPAVFGEIIYNNFLFDIPKILDLCVLYGKGNGPLLHKMIENIFSQQEAYYSDLDETIPTVLQVLDNILKKCGLQMDGAFTGEPQKLGVQGAPSLMDISLMDFVDVVQFLCDTCTTLCSFLDIFPTACKTFQNHKFLTRLACFYEILVPELETAIRRRTSEDKRIQEDLWTRLCHSQKKMIEIAHFLINYCCLQPILESSSENINLFVEDFLQIFTTLIQEKRFLADYDEQFPVADDISLLQQVSPFLDDTRTSYILQGVESAWEGLGRKKHGVPTTHTSHPEPHKLEAEGAVGGSEAQPQREINKNTSKPSQVSVSSGELESLIFQVQDLLPDLGEGFIMACLEEYAFDSEVVINNILESKLLPNLEKLDRTLPRPKKEVSTVLSSRCNIFDDDEFDVFNRDHVDTSCIWKGKRQRGSARALVNDKQHVKEQKERYKSYEVVVEEIPVGEGSRDGFYTDNYDDEYDDTYDANQVGANDQDDDTELLSRRPFTTPLILSTKNKQELENERDDNEDDDYKEEEKNNGPMRDLFIQDPAVLREQAEARRAAQYHRRGFKPDSSANVTGAPRGRGQSKETVQERRKKESHKSTRANHNRRAMADRKRNKGMIPS